MLFSVSRLLCFLTSWVSVMISVHPAAWLSGEATKVLKYSLSFTCFYVLHWQSSSFRHSRTSFSSNWKSGVLASFYLVKTTTAKKILWLQNTQLVSHDAVFDWQCSREMIGLPTMERSRGIVMTWGHQGKQDQKWGYSADDKVWHTFAIFAYPSLIFSFMAHYDLAH